MQKETVRSLEKIRAMAKKEESFDQKRFIRTKEAMETYHIGRTRMVEISRDAGAVLKIDGTLLIDAKKLDEYIESFRIPSRNER